MKKITTPELEKALKALEQAEAEHRKAIAEISTETRAARAHNDNFCADKGSTVVVVRSSRVTQAHILEGKEKWVRPNRQQRLHDATAQRTQVNRPESRRGTSAQPCEGGGTHGWADISIGGSGGWEG